MRTTGTDRTYRVEELTTASNIVRKTWAKHEAYQHYQQKTGKTTNNTKQPQTTRPKPGAAAITTTTKTTTKKTTVTYLRRQTLLALGSRGDSLGVGTLTTRTPKARGFLLVLLSRRIPQKADLSTALRGERGRGRCRVTVLSWEHAQPL